MVVTRAGVLRCYEVQHSPNYSNQNTYWKGIVPKLWVESNQKRVFFLIFFYSFPLFLFFFALDRHFFFFPSLPPLPSPHDIILKYIPRTHDRVIGVITKNKGMHYMVNINAPKPGILGKLEFEGATKSNKPNLKVGDIVYAQITDSDKYINPQLTCKSPQFHTSKSWVTNECLFMQLTDGLLIDETDGLSLQWCRILNKSESFYLTFLGKFGVPFEVTVGDNARIWINSKNTLFLIVLKNVLLNGQFLNKREFQVMTHALLLLFNALCKRTLQLILMFANLYENIFNLKNNKKFAKKNNFI
ncbi:hypothetical protein RFI_28124 [Reticulomyxa filosa]|uniref:Ribosomal RNA-processing protein 40 n=1 Tax=Reticulomyxa filosa TaxID=46433 RepID=X6M5R0_RETFI|nr:hypothetical protein RFI_28124 [Reticulomyxa filosa]|eukprot:ETO09264.1 hypothetical protein RFI_28124 [Reticulomyxa filosa]